MQNESSKKDTQPAAKPAPYVKPSFSVYGSLTKLTAGGVTSVISDSGSNMMYPG